VHLDHLIPLLSETADGPEHGNSRFNKFQFILYNNLDNNRNTCEGLISGGGDQCFFIFIQGFQRELDVVY
jgi:hypothetical protein